ncbi:MAG: hypothetical protein RLY86_4220 [Pseudomonadota bacterium]|jgi:hypothetical protein
MRNRPSIALCPLVLAIIGSAAPLAAASTEVLGGDSSAIGNLRIISNDSGSMQIYRWNGSGWEKQFYAPSIFPDSGNTSDSWFVNGTRHLLASTTQRLNGNTITSTATSGSFVLSRIITYKGTGQSVNYTFRLTNTSSAPVSDLRFFQYRDTYLSGADQGGGFYNATGPNPVIGVKRTVGSLLPKLSLYAITPPFSYESRRYNTVAVNVAAGALAGVVDADESIDNGYAFEWRSASLAAGGTWTVNSAETFDLKYDLIANEPPTIAMPLDRRVVMATASGAVAALNPTSVSDPDDDPISFEWSLLSGAPATAASFSPDAATRNVTATLRENGLHTFNLAASDGQTTTSATIAVQVDLPNEWTIVDGAVNFSTSGSWNRTTASLGYGLTKALIGANASSSATWSFPVTAGWYEVQAWAPVSSGYPSAQAYTITGAGESSVRTQNLSFGLTGWRRLGLFRAGAGGLSVSVAGQGAIADAVRTIKYNGQVIDNGQTGFSTVGSWSLEPRGGLNNSSVQYTGINGAVARWAFPAQTTNAHMFAYLVTNATTNSATWSAQIQRQGKATMSFNLNPTLGSARWADLGRIPLSGTSTFQLTNREAKGMRADAVALALDTVVNELGAGYTEFGSNWQTGSLIGNSGSAIRRTISPTAFARWRAALPTHGYKVWAWVPRATNACSSVRYEIGPVGTIFKVTVNQRIGSSGWVDLGTYPAIGLNSHPFVNSIGEVRAYRVGTDGPMLVDAVRFEPVGDTTGVTAVTAASN